MASLLIKLEGNMKKECCLLIMTFVLGLLSCSQDDSINEYDSNSMIKNETEAYQMGITVEEFEKIPIPIREKRKAAMLLSEYVSLSGTIYSLDINKDDAIKIGVDTLLYEDILKDIEETNQIVNQSLQEGVDVELADVKNEYRKYKESLAISKQMRSGNNGADQYGSISTNGTETGEDYFYPTITKSSVKFYCRTAAAIIPVYTCKTYVMGTWNAKTKTGSLLTTTEVTVPLAASGSGLCATVAFATTDSNGGYCNWQAI